MAVTVLVGIQWGDEGKGKVIDVLSAEAELVVRFQGGSNAGHTVEVGAEKYVLHLIPSGILNPASQCVIGNGLVVDPVELEQEIQGLEARGVAVRPRLMLSARAHLVMKYHRLIDAWREGDAKDGAIGTTQRGIGPAYEDKASRVGLRGIDLTKPDVLEAKFRAGIARYQQLCVSNGAEPIDVEAEWQQLRQAASALAPLVGDAVWTVNQALRDGRDLLCEGAQGMWLDIDYGTYPFVTSSNTTTGGACTGAGLAPRHIDRVIGVTKAYTTRVGNGPFPTELLDDQGALLRKAGAEFGATTGRPRRCGWFDAVASRYSVMVNGVTRLAITKLDVLGALPQLGICRAYEIDGKTVEVMPCDTDLMCRAKPVLEWLPGWEEDLAGAQSWADLPDNAQRYLERLSQLLEAPIGMVSTGPARDAHLVL